MIVRRGHTTTEFWLAALAVAAIVFFKPSPEIAASIAGIVGSFAVSRGLAKRGA